ncbi:MAG: SMP-30/gluconolactonase/LRE family protein [Novosphingobium sp.]|nr:SMP-30/gluconolactonase/LRE family protein [Novosphingobium sp.]
MRTTTPEIKRIVDAKNVIGETPVWSVAERVLYWIDCEDPKLQRWDPATGEVAQWPMPDRIGGFALKEGGGMLVVLASGVYDFDLASGEMSLRAKSPFEAPVALHECACDPTGRFWVGSMNQTVGAGNAHPGGAALFRLEGNELVCEADGFSCANGLAFAPDGRTLYISDSTTQRCDKYPLDTATGKLGERETFFALEPDQGFVDGAAIDTEGAYWCPLVYTARLRRTLPDGTADLEVALPFNNPTMVAFGGKDMTTMFVTSTSQSIGFPMTELEGGLFAFNSTFTGRPANLFRG